MPGRIRIPRLRAGRIDTGGTSGLVSVVLPVYNGERYLAEAIESVLSQTYQNWELIVVDDGSGDQSRRIGEEYARKDSRIQVISQKNQKLPRALNNGFARAKGEFFTWISADNRYLPRFLEAMTEEMAKHPWADMVFGNQYLIDEAGTRITGHGWFEFPPGSGAVCFPPATPLLNTVANNTIGAAFLYRSGCDRVLGGYSPHLFLLEDYDYFMRMNSLFHIRHRRGEPLYEYRFHPESLTAHDEDLHITASRPRLMAFDARRRREYGEPVSCRIQDVSHEMKHRLSRLGVQVTESGELQYRIEKTETGYRVWKDDVALAVLKNRRDLAGFLRLRAVSDRLREEESEFFANSSLPK